MISRFSARTGAGAEAEAHIPGWLARQVLALFAEARRRRRRRRLAITAALLAAAALAGGLVIAARGGGSHRVPASRPSGPGPGHAPAFSLPSAFVAWFDANGALRIGNVAKLAQRPVAQLGWQPCCRLVTAGGRIYWAGQSAGQEVVQASGPATRAIRDVAPGWAVFASSDRRAVYIAQSETCLLVLAADGRGTARRLVTPPGWRLADPLPLAAAGGIILSTGARPPAIGLWQSATGTIQVIGHGSVMAAWTRSSGRGSLIAWQRPVCRRLSCPIEITSTPSGRTLSVPSPVTDGFFLFQGGDAAFSPDGTELAAFVSTGPLRADSAPPFLLALVNTATGAVRLVRGAVLANGELAGWLVWLPTGTRLLAGPARNGTYPGYAIDSRTATAEPFSFFPGCCNPGTSPYDITYGAALAGSSWGRSGSR